MRDPEQPDHDDQLRVIAAALIAEAPQAPQLFGEGQLSPQATDEITPIDVAGAEPTDDMDEAQRRWLPLAVAAALVLLGAVGLTLGLRSGDDSVSPAAVLSQPDDVDGTEGDPAPVRPGGDGSFAFPADPIDAGIELAADLVGFDLIAVVKPGAGIERADGTRVVPVYTEPGGAPRILAWDSRSPFERATSSYVPPDGELPPVHLIEPGEAAPLVLPIVEGDVDDEWLRVLTPVGGWIWIERADVDVIAHAQSLLIDVGRETGPKLQLVSQGELQVDEPVTLGADSNLLHMFQQSWILNARIDDDGVAQRIDLGTVSSAGLSGRPFAHIAIHRADGETGPEQIPPNHLLISGDAMDRLVALTVPGIRVTFHDGDAALEAAHEPIGARTRPLELESTTAFRMPNALGDATPAAWTRCETSDGAEPQESPYRQVAFCADRLGPFDAQVKQPIGSFFAVARPDAGLAVALDQDESEATVTAPIVGMTTAPPSPGQRVIPVFDARGGEPRLLVYENDVLGIELGFPIMNPTVWDQPVVLRIVRGLPGDEWLEVQAPTRPTRRTVFVRAADFELASTTASIEIDARVGGVLTLFDRGESVLTNPVVSARTSRPHTFHDTLIDQVFEATDLGPVYGNWIATHNTWSEALGTFGGGGFPGQTLHGTNNPELVDQAISSGGIRVPDEIMQDLVDAPGGLLGASIVIHSGSEGPDGLASLRSEEWSPARTMDFDPAQVPAVPVPVYS